MDETTQQGIITATIDAGSIVSVGITTGDGQQRWYAADGNLWRKAHAAIGKPSLCGLRIEYGVSDWGGLLYFSVIEDGHVVCPNCRAHIPPEFDPDVCAFARHPRKNIGNGKAGGR